MLIIPAIDIKGGACVRLTQGRMDAETIYSTDPVEVARRWAALGPRLIHIVDLDGAVDGEPSNYKVIERIASAVDCQVQIGGGIRDERTADKYLRLKNVKRIILGTVVVENPKLLATLAKKYPGRLAAGIDAKDGFVAIKGWVDVTDKRASELATELEGQGISCIIYTDISRDGMLKGPNVKATCDLADSVDIPVVASGGISTIDDVRAYLGRGVEGMIIGKALYTGAIDLKEAIKAAGC